MREKKRPQILVPDWIESASVRSSIDGEGEVIRIPGEEFAESEIVVRADDFPTQPPTEGTDE